MLFFTDPYSKKYPAWEMEPRSHRFTALGSALFGGASQSFYKHASEKPNINEGKSNHNLLYFKSILFVLNINNK